MPKPEPYQLVVDLSNNDLGQTDFACLKAHGVAAVILSPFSRINPPHEMAELADDAKRAGMPILSWYGLPYFGSIHGEERDLRWCVDLQREYPSLDRTIWADCEADACDNGWNVPRPTPDERVAALWHCKRDIVEAAGCRFGVYAGTYWWRDNMGNTRAFMLCPWWLPHYGPGGMPAEPIYPENPDPENVLSFTPILSGHQFTSLWERAEGIDCGRENRDASYWYEQLMEGSPMTPEENRFLRMREAIRGAAASLDDDVVQKAYAALKAAGVVPDVG